VSAKAKRAHGAPAGLMRGGAPAPPLHYEQVEVTAGYGGHGLQGCRHPGPH